MPSTLTVLVVDASVLTPDLTDAGDEGARLRDLLRGQTLAGPDLLRVEVTSVLRRLAASGRLELNVAETAFENLLAMPIDIYRTAPMLPRAWELRGNITSYEACYVALAEVLNCPLLTADARLARAPGPRCQIDLAPPAAT